MFRGEVIVHAFEDYDIFISTTLLVHPRQGSLQGL